MACDYPAKREIQRYIADIFVNHQNDMADISRDFCNRIKDKGRDHRNDGKYEKHTHKGDYQNIYQHGIWRKFIIIKGDQRKSKKAD